MIVYNVYHNLVAPKPIASLSSIASLRLPQSNTKLKVAAAKTALLFIDY